MLVVGGGDGGAVREVAKHPEVEEIHQCEIDEVTKGKRLGEEKEEEGEGKREERLCLIQECLLSPCFRGWLSSARSSYQPFPQATHLLN